MDFIAYGCIGIAVLVVVNVLLEREIRRLDREIKQLDLEERWLRAESEALQRRADQTKEFTRAMREKMVEKEMAETWRLN